jgi:hypothetical protein
MLTLINKTQSLVAIDWFVQVALINRFLPNLKVKYLIQSKFHVLKFDVQPKAGGRIFRMEVKYFFADAHGVQLYQPFLYCNNIDIVKHIDNHIFASGGICYFYPADLSHRQGISCLFAIQCAIKWCDCYSYWEENKAGGWPCNEMSHGSYHPAFFNVHRPLL